ncbi:hypothetical protein CVN86_24855, partial [Salmonella enterica]|nr:hypothetical protein [Salmonella enterica]
NPDNDAERKGAGRKFAETLRGNAATHYGHAGPEFVRWLISRNDSDTTSTTSNGQTLADMYAILREQFPVSTGQEARAAARFALCALAGEMAITAGILPWKQSEALEAVKAMFDAWSDYRGQGQSEDVKILRAVAGFIARHASRFEGGSAYSEPVSNRAGWWRPGSNGDRVYWFLPDALSEAASGYDLKRIAASLDNAGAIVDRDTDGKRRYTKRVSVNGEKHRVYAIGQNALLFAIDE